MHPRLRALIQAFLLILLFVLLLGLFPGAFAFVELAARELRYLWWLVLLVLLACWLIWAGCRKTR
jgi:hypothetical protein